MSAGSQWSEPSARASSASRSTSARVGTSMPRWAKAPAAGGAAGVAEEHDEHQDERVLDLALVGEPRRLAVGVLRRSMRASGVYRRVPVDRGVEVARSAAQHASSGGSSASRHHGVGSDHIEPGFDGRARGEGGLGAHGLHGAGAGGGPEPGRLVQGRPLRQRHGQGAGERVAGAGGIHGSAGNAGMSRVPPTGAAGSQRHDHLGPAGPVALRGARPSSAASTVLATTTSARAIR